MMPKKMQDAYKHERFITSKINALVKIATLTRKVDSHTE